MKIYFDRRSHLLRAIYRIIRAEHILATVCTLEFADKKEQLCFNTPPFPSEPLFVARISDPLIFSIQIECIVMNDAGEREVIRAHCSPSQPVLSVDEKDKNHPTSAEEDFGFLVEAFSSLLSANPDPHGQRPKA